MVDKFYAHIICGDALKEMARIEPESIDCIVTSPPYNINLKYHKYQDNLGEEEYLCWMENVFQDCNRVLKKTGHLFLNFGGTNTDPEKPYEVIRRSKGLFILQNDIIWLKSISMDGDSRGHFKPINSPRFLNNLYEHVFHLTKSGDIPIDRLSIGVPFKYKSNVKRFGHTQDKRCAGNVWFIPYRTVASNSQRYNHPGTYPPELAVKCLRLAGSETDKNMVVLDPFVGTGSTLVACKMEGLSQCIGMDMDAEYCRIARMRLKQDIRKESKELEEKPIDFVNRVFE